MSDQKPTGNRKKIKTAKLIIFTVEFELLGGKRGSPLKARRADVAEFKANILMRRES
jgi:hypothetical protein